MATTNQSKRAFLSTIGKWLATTGRTILVLVFALISVRAIGGWFATAMFLVGLVAIYVYTRGKAHERRTH
jgi:hypothetical protein